MARADGTIRRAFDIEALRKRLVGLAIKLIWDRDAAEDLVQEAFELMLAKRTGLGGSIQDAWLWRTVCNLCMNHRRRRRFESLDPTICSLDDSPEWKMVSRERLDRVRTIIATLPTQQRIALVLRLMENLDYREIGEIMEISEAAARTHVHLARVRLAESVQEMESGQ